MYRVFVEKECSCFKKSGEKREQFFETEIEAKEEADTIVEEMNELYCKKHLFSVEKMEDGFLVKVDINV